MADRHESRMRRRRRWIAAAVAVVGVAGGTLAVTGGHGGGARSGAAASSTAVTSAAGSAAASPAPSPSGSPADSPSPAPSGSVPPSASTAPSAAPAPTASAAAGRSSAAAPGVPTAAPSATRAPVTTSTVPGNPNLLADHAGQAELPLGPDAGLKAVAGGDALSLKGNTNSYAQSTSRVVDTARGFTVSAWVYNDAAGGSRSAISQGDGASFTFDLARDDSNGQQAWAFRVQTADGGADSTVVQVRSVSTATTSQWVLLSGSYDAAQHTITLYVNGAAAGSAKVPGVWNGPGPLELGRSRHQGAWAAPWAGVIGHIQVWDRALGPAEVAAVKSSGGAGPSAPPIDSWLV